MADYQPLITKAVAGLERNTGEARRALYERARTALVAQLRGVVPALSESDITRERLALEEAIRKVEAESARKSRYEPASRPESRPPARPAREESADGHRAASQADNLRPDASTEQETNAKPEVRAEPGPSTTAAELRRSRARPAGDRASLSDEGLKGFRDVVAEAETLGEATAQAGRTAREAYASVPLPGSESERLEPHIEPEGLRPRPRRAPAPEPAKMRDADRQAEIARSREGQDPARGRQPIAPDLSRAPAAAARDWRSEPNLDVRPAHVDEYVGDDFDYAERHPSAEAKSGEAPPSRRALGRPPGETEAQPRLHALRRWLKLAIVAFVTVAVVAVIAWQRQPIMTMMSGLTSMFSSKPTAPTPREATPSRSKISDRVGDAQRGGQSGQVAAVAQRVVLYEEDPADPAGKQYVGTAVWRNESVSPSPGQAPEMAVRADIEIPDRKINMRWSLRRNTDAALPASHTIEIMFNLPTDFSHGGIQNIPGILMKQAEQTRGVPLSGLAVKVTTNFFLIGLSSVEADMQRNISLLKERAWFDVPVVYNDGRRAILAVEKGNPGDRAFLDAFAAWSAKGK
jgi:hypothetical protein